MRSTWVAIV